MLAGDEHKVQKPWPTRLFGCTHIYIRHLARLLQRLASDLLALLLLGGVLLALLLSVWASRSTHWRRIAHLQAGLRMALTHLRVGLRTALAGGLGEALWLFATLRVAFSLFALLASYLFRLPAPCAGGEPAPVLQATGRAFRLLGVWQRWDACWYEQIATQGYQPGNISVNFYPLYPFLMRVVAEPLAGNLTFSGLVISGVAYVMAMTGLYRLVCDDFNEAVARRTLLYLSVFPAAFFLFAPFTEALFLALTVWTLYLARRSAWGWVAPLAFLVGLTRTQGVLLAIPLAWEFVRQWRAGRRALPPAFVALLPPCGFFMYNTYAKIFTGLTPLETGHKYWGNVVRPPWTIVATSWQFIAGGRGDSRGNNAVEAVNLALLVLFAVILLAGLRRLPAIYTFYAVPQVAVAAMDQRYITPLASNSRYLLVIFPVFVILALVGRDRRLHYSWLLVSTLLLALLVCGFLLGAFIG